MTTKPPTLSVDFTAIMRDMPKVKPRNAVWGDTVLFDDQLKIERADSGLSLLNMTHHTRGGQAIFTFAIQIRAPLNLDPLPTPTPHVRRALDRAVDRLNQDLDEIPTYNAALMSNRLWYLHMYRTHTYEADASDLLDAKGPATGLRQSLFLHVIIPYQRAWAKCVAAMATADGLVNIRTLHNGHT